MTFLKLLCPWGHSSWGADFKRNFKFQSWCDKPVLVPSPISKCQVLVLQVCARLKATYSCEDESIKRKIACNCRVGLQAFFHMLRCTPLSTTLWDRHLNVCCLPHPSPSPLQLMRTGHLPSCWQLCKFSHVHLGIMFSSQCFLSVTQFLRY